MTGCQVSIFPYSLLVRSAMWLNAKVIESSGTINVITKSVEYVSLLISLVIHLQEYLFLQKMGLNMFYKCVTCQLTNMY